MRGTFPWQIVQTHISCSLIVSKLTKDELDWVEKSNNSRYQCGCVRVRRVIRHWWVRNFDLIFFGVFSIFFHFLKTWNWQVARVSSHKSSHSFDTFKGSAQSFLPKICTRTKALSSRQQFTLSFKAGEVWRMLLEDSSCKLRDEPGNARWDCERWWDSPGVVIVKAPPGIGKI